VPNVVISIVNHQNRALLADCLLSIPAACEGIDYQVTVVDNVSGDGSLEMLAGQFPAVAVIVNHTRLGFGANHNLVLRPLVAEHAARGSTTGPDYVLILNDDTTLEPGAVARMAAMLDASPTLAAVVPTVVDTSGRAGANRIAYPTARSAWRCDWTDRTEPPDPVDGFLQGCCLMVRVAAIAQVGVFDEAFFLFYEDTDLSRRLADARWLLGACPEAVVTHIGHASVLRADLAANTPKQGRRSRYLYLCKHVGRPRAELITGVGRILLLARAVKATAGAAVHGTSDPVRRQRVQRLFALAALDPRQPTEPEMRSGLRTGSR
jgi:GT2 family glycosyltransferase